MATIGTFTSTENGFTGSIRTLALNVKARIARVENPSDKGPQFRVYAGSVELGAAWQKTSEQGRDYLSGSCPYRWCSSAVAKPLASAPSTAP
ncbi:DUF736 domain-containing protein [Ensifer sp. ENS07]|uniref:DUF736 domain-containing protein n=1 Tax=Ensifer sp. ENS07 TaxID=2769274 RepID=UPI0035303D88